MTWYNIKENELWAPGQFYTFVPDDRWFMMSFRVTSNNVVNKRAIYTFLDWLGDVGGLLGSLQLIGSAFMYFNNYIRGNKLEFYLLNRLYKKETEKAKDGETTQETVNRLEKRTPYSLPNVFCHCKRNRKELRLLEKGVDRAMDEFEIDSFIKT